MSDESRLDAIVWPKAVVTKNAELNWTIIQSVANYRNLNPEAGTLDRLAFVRGTMETAASVLVERAEIWVAAPGKEKKRLVVNDIMWLLRNLEGRLDLVPAKLEPMVFWFLRKQVDRLVERVFRRLEATGVVNVGKGLDA